MRRFDFVVIGAGIVGLSVARALQAKKWGSVLILEKEAALGLHASGRNSGVLHAGIYYGPDSLKAKVCAEGARRMAAYAKEKGIALKKTGKVIVVSERRELPRLRELFERSVQNGVRTELVSEKQLQDIEPEARTFEQALFSPDTAVVDAAAVLCALEKDLLDGGGVLLKDAAVRSVEGERVRTRHENFEFGHLINAAGLHADALAHQMGVGLQYRILPFKGIYKKIRSEAAKRFRRLIYPVPDPELPFLGAHITKSVDGGAYAGPTALPAFGREHYGFLKGIDRNAGVILLSLSGMMLKNVQGMRKLAAEEARTCFGGHFLRSVQKLAPRLKREDLLASDKVGIRAQLVDTRRLSLVMDFLIERGRRSTHVLNAVSPGFTSGFTFADVVLDRIGAPA